MKIDRNTLQTRVQEVFTYLAQNHTRIKSSGIISGDIPYCWDSSHIIIRELIARPSYNAHTVSFCP